jgi:AmmeMemoRadiSam system protein B
MATIERPRLRPLSVRRHEQQGHAYALLTDPLAVFDQGVLIPIDMFLQVVRHFDGSVTLPEIQARVLRETGRLITLAELEQLIEELDRAMVLHGPTFEAFHQAYRESRSRPAALAGRSYAGTERALRSQLSRFFTDSRGAGAWKVQKPESANGSVPTSNLRGILSPHIDFERGGLSYTWSYKELVEQSRADVFVIFGVAHQYCRHRFSLTYKDFETPLGTVPTDRDYVSRIVDRAGEHLFEDELAHRTEHSIEFQAVFLQHVLGDQRPFSIVPILVGSFHDLMEQGIDPIADPEVGRVVNALREVESASGKRVAYIGGIDLCHAGPQFGDPLPVDGAVQDEIRAFDGAMLARAEVCDARGWFETASRNGNRWRVCGLAATYTMLQTIGPARGRILNYDQAVDGARTCCVSFASMVFHADEPDGSAATTA